MPGRTVTVTVLGDTKSLEAALTRAGLVAETSADKITKSAAVAGEAAAAQAREVGLSADKQAESAGKAAAAYQRMADRMSMAQKVAGKAALDAAKMAGASADEQAAAYDRAVAAQSRLEASTKRLAATQKGLVKFGGYTTLGLAAGLYESAKGAMQLQSAMKQLQTQAGVSQAEMTKMTGAVLRLAGPLATSPLKLADSLYHVESAGFRGSEALGIMSTAAKEAKISGADLTDTTTALTAAVFSGIQGAQNFTQAMGLLNATVGAGDMHFQDLNEAFAGPMLATVKGYGLSLRDVGAALATFGDLNIRGAEAATQLRMAVQYMAKPAATAGPLLEKLGLNTHSFADAMANGGLLPALQLLHDKMAAAGVQGNQMAQVIGDLFTKKGAAGVTILENSPTKLESKYKSVSEGAKDQSKAWGKWNDTLAAQVDHLKTTMQALGDKLGMWLVPKLKDVAQWTSNVIGWFEKHRTAAAALAAVVSGVLGAAVGAFVAGKGYQLLMWTKSVGGALAGMAVTTEETATAVDGALLSTGIGAALVGLGAAAVALQGHWGSIWDAIKQATQDAANVIVGAINWIIGKLDWMIQKYNSTLGQLLGTVGQIGKLGDVNLMGGGLGNLTKLSLRTGQNPIYNVHNYLHNAGVPGVRGSTGPGGVWTGPSGKVTEASFAASVLSRLGIKTTAQAIRDFTAWEQQEGGNWANNAKYNPLNTTLREPGSYSINSVGVQAYTSWKEGMIATIKTLQNGYYGQILRALKEGVPLSEFSGIVAGSKWGTGAINTPGVGLSNKQLAALLGDNTLRHKAAATSAIPVGVATMLATAQSLLGTKYTWGGGHNGWDPVAELKKIGVDCSGFVSQVLHAGGVSLPGPQTTEGLAHYLHPGKNKFVTVWDRATGPQTNQHTLIDILGKWFESGGLASPNGVSQITAKQASQELAGGGFRAYHPDIHGPMATHAQLRRLGISGSLAGAVGAMNIGHLVQQYMLALKAQIAEKAAESLALEATQLRDQTQKMTNHYNDELAVIKDRYQKINDAAQAQLQAIRDMTQIVTDRWAAMTQAVTDAAQVMSDSVSARVQAINDQTQIQVDTLAERGLFGLNLVAQKLQVQLDQQKAADDRKIALAQLTLDRVTQSGHAAEAAAQMRLDQVTRLQDIASSVAQQKADTVQIKQAIRLAAAQARLDTLTLHEDVSVVGPAQTAMDMHAGAPANQAAVYSAQLRRAEGVAGVAEGKMAKQLASVQFSVDKLTAAAQQAATVAANTAQKQIAAANQILANVTGQANLQAAQAQASLQAIQGQAATTEAGLQQGVSVTQEQAQVMYAGAGVVVNLYGINPTDAAANAEALGWTLRTLVPA